MAVVPGEAVLPATATGRRWVPSRGADYGSMGGQVNLNSSRIQPKKYCLIHAPKRYKMCRHDTICSFSDLR
jgi:hypothetical protein